MIVCRFIPRITDAPVNISLRQCRHLDDIAVTHGIVFGHSIGTHIVHRAWRQVLQPDHLAIGVYPVGGVVVGKGGVRAGAIAEAFLHYITTCIGQSAENPDAATCVAFVRGHCGGRARWMSQAIGTLTCYNCLGGIGHIREATAIDGCGERAYQTAVLRVVAHAANQAVGVVLHGVSCTLNVGRCITKIGQHEIVATHPVSRSTVAHKTDLCRTVGHEEVERIGVERCYCSTQSVGYNPRTCLFCIYVVLRYVHSRCRQAIDTARQTCDGLFYRGTAQQSWGSNPSFDIGVTSFIG